MLTALENFHVLFAALGAPYCLILRVNVPCWTINFVLRRVSWADQRHVLLRNQIW
jgi:hypothetical protein